jgi:hypothetical protein
MGQEEVLYRKEKKILLEDDLQGLDRSDVAPEAPTTAFNRASTRPEPQ